MEILQNFALNRPYKLILYLSSIILVLSFITKPLDININELRSICFSITTVGIIAWMIDYIYTRTMNDKRYISDEDRNDYTRYIGALNIGYFIISLLIIDNAYL